LPPTLILKFKKPFGMDFGGVKLEP